MALPAVVGLVHPLPAESMLLYALIVLFDLGAVGLGLKGLAGALRRPRRRGSVIIAGRPGRERGLDQAER